MLLPLSHAHLDAARRRREGDACGAPPRPAARSAGNVQVSGDGNVGDGIAYCTHGEPFVFNQAGYSVRGQFDVQARPGRGGGRTRAQRSRGSRPAQRLRTACSAAIGLGRPL